MKLHNLLPPYGKKYKIKRVGRGDSSGRGNTSGRGNPGEKSRKGRVHYLGFEGGQMPLYRRLPKRGFTPLTKERYQEVNLCSLNVFKGEEEVTPEILYKEGLIKKIDEKIKILGKGTLETTLIVKAHRFSFRAKDEIVKKGGKAIEIGASPSLQTKNRREEKIEIKKVVVKESLKEKEEKIEEKTKEVKVTKTIEKEGKIEKKQKTVKEKKSVKNKDKAKTKGKKKDK